MNTPFEKWITCPKCKGTGGDNTVLDWDPDYAPPRCPRCGGVGEIDPENLTKKERIDQIKPALDELREQPANKNDHWEACHLIADEFERLLEIFLDLRVLASKIQETYVEGREHEIYQMIGIVEKLARFAHAVGGEHAPE